VKSYLTPNLVKSASSFTHEPESAVQQTMHGGVATLLGGLTGMASSPEGVSNLGNLTRDAGSFDTLGNLTSAFGGGGVTSNLTNMGGQMLGKIFGSKSSSITDAIGNSGGVSGSSAKTLMSLLAPIALGALGKFGSARGLSNSGLANTLLSQKDEIASAMPSGVSQLLGFGGPKATPVPVPPRETRQTPVERDTRYGAPERDTRYATGERVDTTRKGGLGWLPWLLIALVAAGLLWSLLGRARRTGEVARNTTGAVQGAMSKLSLPNGTTLTVPQGSINYNLAQYLSDGSQSAPRSFTFDQLNFQTGTTQLTQQSVATVNDLSQIMKAYPNATFELAGHTDNTGSAQTNQQLSLDRANAVKQALVNGGVDANRVNTAGYGQEKPIASNDTEEGKARNRRLELTVTAK
jgi:outer membrane protein OmpA-like peptidoglycan-associated protein